MARPKSSGPAKKEWRNKYSPINHDDVNSISGVKKC